MPPKNNVSRLSFRLKSLLSIVLCVGVLTGAFGVFHLLASLKKPPAQRQPVTKVYNVDVFDVERADLREIISAFGTAQADREVVVSAQVAGEIVEVHPRLKIGEKVQAPQITVGKEGKSQRSSGDLLLRIDPKSYQEQVVQLKNRLEEDQAELNRLEQEEANNARILKKVKNDYELFQKEYERIQKLNERGVATESEVNQALLDLRQFEETIIRQENESKLFPLKRKQIVNRRKTHQADLQIAQLDLERTEVKPPFHGILSDVMVEKGHYVRPGDPLVKLLNISTIEIPLAISLNDYNKLVPLMENNRTCRVVLAENETSPGRWFGEVTRIAPQADQATRTIKIFVEVDNTKQTSPLVPGTFVHARIDGPVLKEAIVVPRDTISNGNLFVARNGQVEKRNAEIRQTLQSLAVVGNGLQNGDQVVLTNLDILQEGSKVQVRSHRDLSDELENQRLQTARQVVADDGSSQEGEAIN